MPKKRSQPRHQGFAEETQLPFGRSDRQQVEVGAGGRLVIPAAFRAALGIKPGDRLTMRLDGNELRIHTYEEGLNRARKLLRQSIPETVDPVEDFLAYKREEAARDEAKLENREPNE